MSRPCSGRFHESGILVCFSKKTSESELGTQRDSLSAVTQTCFLSRWTAVSLMPVRYFHWRQLSVQRRGPLLTLLCLNCGYHLNISNEQKKTFYFPNKRFKRESYPGQSTRLLQGEQCDVADVGVLKQRDRTSRFRLPFGLVWTKHDDSCPSLLSFQLVPLRCLFDVSSCCGNCQPFVKLNVIFAIKQCKESSPT